MPLATSPRVRPRLNSSRGRSPRVINPGVRGLPAFAFVLTPSSPSGFAQIRRLFMHRRRCAPATRRPRRLHRRPSTVLGAGLNGRPPKKSQTAVAVRVPRLPARRPKTSRRRAQAGGAAHIPPSQQGLRACRGIAVRPPTPTGSLFALTDSPPPEMMIAGKALSWPILDYGDGKPSGPSRRHDTTGENEGKERGAGALGTPREWLSRRPTGSARARESLGAGPGRL